MAFFDFDASPNRFTIGIDTPIDQAIRGLGGRDVVFGSPQSDSIYGNDGADVILGLAGDDQGFGGRGADLLSGNTGADTLEGQRGNDALFGGQGDDLLLGQEGNDFLAGDVGRDTLTGGDGSDAFVVDVRHGVNDISLADVITDFSLDDGDVLALTDGAGDTLTEADLTLTTIDGNTQISLTATGAILAQVQGITAEDLTGAFSTVAATLDDTEPGARFLGILPTNAQIQGFVGDADYLDFFQFEVAETSIVNFSLTGLTADADLLLYQDFNGDGELGGDELISVSERSGNTDETLENITLDVGSYFLAVEQFEGEVNYTMDLSAVAGSVANDLAGDRTSTARALPQGGEVELHDHVGGNDAIDTYRLEVLNSGFLDTFTNFQQSDINLTLWRDLNANEVLDTNEIVTTGTNEFQVDNVAAGTYYVNVTAIDATTPYSIYATVSPGSRVGTESYNPLFVGLSQGGRLTQNDEYDPFDAENFADPYFLPELAVGSIVNITQTSDDFDAYLTVVDLLTQEVIAANDDIDTEGGDFNAQVSFTVEQGKQYIVFASSVDAPGFGDYTLTTTLEPNSVSETIGSTPKSSQSSNTSLKPAPVFNEQGERADIGTSKDQTFQLTYNPLTGGLLNSIRVTNLNQGRFGNCAFLAAMAATFGRIEDLSSVDSRASSVLDGAVSLSGDEFNIRFYNFASGQPTSVTVNNQVVTKPEDKDVFGAKWSNDSVTTENAGGQQIWASVFERAYALFREGETGKNGYDVIGNGDYGSVALRRISGQQVESIFWSPDSTEVTYEKSDLKEDGSSTSLGSLTADAVFEQVQTALSNGKFAIAGTVSNAEKQSGGVIIGGHAYSVHDALTLQDGTKALLVRNPWGNDNGSDAKFPQDPSANTKDGFVTIPFDTFVKTFNTVGFTK
ncbi:MAG: hypothetical protein HC795_16975 [Coleofasciculaceae cyanobacterium RL_1_1]|nr:hypothetical protein [Coleofasciculaceae cyanobacterium RL_1_1]